MPEWVIPGFQGDQMTFVAYPWISWLEKTQATYPGFRHYSKTQAAYLWSRVSFHANIAIYLIKLLNKRILPFGFNEFEQLQFWYELAHEFFMEAIVLLVLE